MHIRWCEVKLGGGGAAGGRATAAGWGGSGWVGWWVAHYCERRHRDDDKPSEKWQTVNMVPRNIVGSSMQCNFLS
jgi:hypothetical protein